VTAAATSRKPTSARITSAVLRTIRASAPPIVSYFLRQTNSPDIA
jgi:hypothetical protein